MFNLAQLHASRFKPSPMNSVDFVKLASIYLRLESHAAAHIAEELYSKGIISYPRTETQIFDESIDLPALVSLHAAHPMWGAVVQDMLRDPGGKFELPRRGEKHDHAHPPIHPLKCLLRGDPDLGSENHWKVYELIVRHFLGCCHRDARGSSTSVTVAMGRETFTATGTVVHELNFMDVYVYQVRTSAHSAAFRISECFSDRRICV
jgi:DNA topoisomerase III